jgi:hypothetical protein
MRDLSKYYLEIEKERGKATAEATEYLYSLFTDGIYTWLASIWDNKIGGFYFSRSAKENEYVEYKGEKVLLLPDIESTSQAFGALVDDGIGRSFEDFPKLMKDKAVKFIASCQDPQDGYFYHKQWGKNINTSRRARDMSKGVGLLTELGARPLYPTAIERIEASAKGGEGNTAVPEHLRSREAFLKYLESLDINGKGKSYVVGHTIASQIPEIKAAGLAEVCYEFLNATAKPNGVWEDELTNVSANGLMKISCAYTGLGKRMPWVLKSFDAATEIASNAEVTSVDGITTVYNPPFVMLNLFSAMKATSDEENYRLCKKMIIERAPKVLRRTADNLKLYAEPDGSFSYGMGRTSFTSQGQPVGMPGLPESDVNANSLAQGARERTLIAMDIPLSPLFDEKDTRNFFEFCGEL